MREGLTLQFGIDCLVSSSPKGEVEAIRLVPVVQDSFVLSRHFQDMGSLLLKVLGGACSLFPDPFLDLDSKVS